MGRKLRRVPLDFRWPKGQIWRGYLNPYASQECKPCKGSGYGPDAKRFSDQWYGNAEFDPVAYGAEPIPLDHPALRDMAARNVAHAPQYYGTDEDAAAREVRRLHDLMFNKWCYNLIQADVDALVAADRLWDFTRRPRTEEQRAALKSYWMDEPNGHHPTAAEVNAWSYGGIGHDSINASVCVEARIKREGGVYRCEFCRGDGRLYATEEFEKLHDEWQGFDPPEGPGYQMWETTSEGSPQSPVFPSLEELSRWCEDNATVFGHEKTNAAEWLRMLGDGFVVHKDTEGGVTKIFT